MIEFNIYNLAELQEVLDTFIHTYAKSSSSNYRIFVFEGSELNGLQIVDDTGKEEAFVHVKENF